MGVNRVHQRLHLDRHRLSYNGVEFLDVLRQHEKWSKSGFSENLVRKYDRDGQVAEFERPDVHNSREQERRPFDGVDLRDAFGRQPTEEIVERTVDELRFGTIVAAIERLNHALAQLARALASAEENRMDLKEARLGRVRNGTGLPGIGSSFHLFDVRVRFFQYRSCVQAFELLQIGKLEPCAKHRLGIDWKVFRHFVIWNAG